MASAKQRDEGEGLVMARKKIFKIALAMATLHYNFCMHKNCWQCAQCRLVSFTIRWPQSTIFSLTISVLLSFAMSDLQYL